MANLKVYGGMTYINGKRVRAIVATTTKSKIARLTHENVRYISDYWSETANSHEVRIALKKPHALFVNCGGDEYVEKIFNEGGKNG